MKNMQCQDVKNIVESCLLSVCHMSHAPLLLALSYIQIFIFLSQVVKASTAGRSKVRCWGVNAISPPPARCQSAPLLLPPSHHTFLSVSSEEGMWGGSPSRHSRPAPASFFFLLFLKDVLRTFLFFLFLIEKDDFSSPPLVCKLIIPRLSEADTLLSSVATTDLSILNMQ